MVKLLGSGEYGVEVPGEPAEGHFGLAVKDYTHSTAPNRRYPDLVTQRLVKAAIAGAPVPYSVAQLCELAPHSSSTPTSSAASSTSRGLDRGGVTAKARGRPTAGLVAAFVSR